MTLVIQATRPIARSELEPLMTSTQATMAEPRCGLAPAGIRCWWLKQARPHSEVESICQQRQWDCSWVGAPLRLNELGWAIFDMDSTLITIECIDEIAAHVGMKEQVARITELAMQGELEFAESLRQRVALLAGLEQQALEWVVRERLQLSPGAPELIAELKRQGVGTWVASGGFDYFTDRVKAMLELDGATANQLEISSGRLSGRLVGAIVDARTKAGQVERLRALRPQRAVLAVGDGANDLPMMARADLSVAFHAKPVVRAQATHRLDWVGMEGVLNLFQPA